MNRGQKSRRGIVAAVGVAAMLAGAAACGSDGGSDNAGKDPKDRTDTLTVWLMQDAETSWPELVKDANTAFNKKYPKVKVKVPLRRLSCSARMAVMRPRVSVDFSVIQIRCT